MKKNVIFNGVEDLRRDIIFLIKQFQETYNVVVDDLYSVELTDFDETENEKTLHISVKSKEENEDYE